MAKDPKIQDLKDAKDRLHKVTDADNKAGRHYETDEYLAANRAVIDAEQHVPWWRR